MSKEEALPPRTHHRHRHGTATSFSARRPYTASHLTSGICGTNDLLGICVHSRPLLHLLGVYRCQPKWQAKIILVQFLSFGSLQVYPAQGWVTQCIPAHAPTWLVQYAPGLCSHVKPLCACTVRNHFHALSCWAIHLLLMVQRAIINTYL